jgi:hypothetical protein
MDIRGLIEETMNRLILLSSTMLVVLVGCDSVGPQKIEPERMDYSDAIRASEEQQLLKNLVRLRFGSSPELLSLSQIVTQYQVQTGGSAGASIATGDNTFPFSVEASFKESPTITYEPVTGQEFALRMLTPLQSWQIYLLTRSGWDLNRMLCATVQQINSLENLQTSFGMHELPSPPTLAKFAEAAALMEELEIARQLRMIVVRSDDRDEDSDSGITSKKMVDQPLEKDSSFSGLDYFMLFNPTVTDVKWSKKIRRLKELLEIKQELNRFPIFSGESGLAYHPSDEVVVMSHRSILSLMLYLTAGVQIPEELEGLAPDVYIMVEELDGISTNDYMVYPASVLTVHSSKEKPENTFVAVPFEGFWFWIEKTDRNSKTTFTLLEYLLRLQEAKSSGQTPGVLLTIPTS